MHKPVRPLIAALVTLVGVSAAVWAAPASSASSVAPSGAVPPDAPAAAPPGWASLQQTALQVTAGYRDDGALTPTGAPGPVSDSTATTASGPVTVAQRTVVAVDGSGTVVVQMILLGGSQLVVDEVSPAAADEGEALVLRPGSPALAGTYPLGGAPAATTTGAPHRPRVLRGPSRAVLAGFMDSGPHRASLVTAGGCSPAPQPPVVISSEFGPLIQGEGIVSCIYSQNLDIIVGLFQGGTALGTPSGTSATTDFLVLNDYYPCTSITGKHSFHTAELWGIAGVEKGEATSSDADLHCA